MDRAIAIIIPSLLSGGAEKQSVYLARVLSPTYKVVFIILKGDKVEAKNINIIEDRKITIYRLHGNLFNNVVTVKQILISENIFISFSYLASGNFINGVSGSLSGTPVRVGGIRNEKLKLKKRYLEKFLHNVLLNYTISNSFAAVNSLKKHGFNANKFHVIHNAFEPDCQYIKRLDKDLVNIVSVARFVPQKDYITALEAVFLLKERLGKTNHKFMYYIVGYGEMEKKIRIKIKELGLSENVKVIIKPENLSPFLINADIFLVSSLYEGMSNSVMEALSYSLPVVTTNAGDMKYLVINEGNGYICNIKDSLQISNKLEKLVRNSLLRNQMGQKSFNLINNKFTLKIFTRKYLSFIENIIGD